RAVFLAENSVIGKLPADERAHALFGRAVRGRHGVESAGLLVLDSERGTKKGRMVSPDALAGWSTKLLKAMAVMSPALCRVSLSESRSAGNRAGGPCALKPIFCCDAGFQPRSFSH